MCEHIYILSSSRTSHFILGNEAHIAPHTCVDLRNSLHSFISSCKVFLIRVAVLIRRIKKCHNHAAESYRYAAVLESSRAVIFGQAVSDLPLRPGKHEVDVLAADGSMHAHAV
jgi:hypothetical protein